MTRGSHIHVFRHSLLEWWTQHARIFPWRTDRSTYRTLIAEMMLRRTRADQVISVFCRFIERYPTLSVAAMGDQAALRDILWPLGLSWRIENIIKLLEEAHLRFGDELPTDSEVLKTLTGVGDYVAAAVACFAGGAAVPIIDTNVVRLIGRYFGINTHGEARRRREMQDMANEALDPTCPADYNYAVLDFAACVCTARKAELC